MPTHHSRKAVRVTPEIAASTSKALRRAFAGWYARCRRNLPWRRTCDPYRIWISEVMLQQTQVQTVEPYYHRFISQFGDVSSLARADLQAVLKLWEGLGYYSRARHLHKAAGIIADEMGGQIPRTWSALRRLPGIGDYIAAAVLSIAFGCAYAVVDGNVKRVLARLFLVDAPVNQVSAHNMFNGLAGNLLDGHDPGNHNQAMMELGALICTPRSPNCDDCPGRRFCKAFQKGVVRNYPKRVQRQPLTIRRLVAGVVVKKGRILVAQRPEQGLLGGLWEFPAGSLDADIDPVRACCDQIKSAVHLDVSVDRPLGAVSHGYTHFKLHMKVYLCRWQSGRVRLKGYTRFKWLSLEHIAGLPLHGAMHKALAFLETISEPVNNSH